MIYPLLSWPFGRKISMDKYQKIVFSLEALSAILFSIAMSICLIWQVYSEVFIVLVLGSIFCSIISRSIAKKKNKKAILYPY